MTSYLTVSVVTAEKVILLLKKELIVEEVTCYIITSL